MAQSAHCACHTPSCTPRRPAHAPRGRADAAGRRRVERGDARRSARRRGACHRGRPASRISPERGRAIERTRARSARAALGMAAGTPSRWRLREGPQWRSQRSSTARDEAHRARARARRDQPVLCGVLFAAAYAAPGRSSGGGGGCRPRRRALRVARRARLRATGPGVRRGARVAARADARRRPGRRPAPAAPRPRRMVA